MDNLFPNYIQFEASDQDPELVKWLALLPEMEVAPPSWISVVLGPTLDAVARVNQGVNQAVTWVPPGPRDEWQTPAQTLERMRGDCMDITVLKYALMVKAGFDPASLNIVLGEIKSLAGNEQHAWLCLEIAPDRYVLDNKFDQLIRPVDYINWRPLKLLLWGKCQLFGPVTVLNQAGDGTV